MRIAIFGAGGTGGFLGGLLAQSGLEVCLIARGENLRAIRERGLKINSPRGDFRVRPALATDDPAQIGPVDNVIVTVKAWQVAEAAQAMAPLVGSDTGVLAIQNGVDAPSQLAAVLGPEHVIIGLLTLRSFLTGPGHVRHTFESDPNLKIGELDNRPSQRVRDLGTMFERAGLSVAIPTDIRVELWEKFAFACYSAGIATVSRCPIGVWRDQPELRRLAEAAGLEAAAIAKAKGIAMSGDLIQRFSRIADGLAPSAKPSMQDDIMSGRPSELEYWNGAAVRMGPETGVETPVNSLIYSCLLPQEMRARGLATFE